MKIVHVVSSLNLAHGGPPSAIIGMAAAQATAGQQIRIICPTEPGVLEQIHQCDRRIVKLKELEIRFIPSCTPAQRFLGQKARQAVERSLVDADFVHVHGVWEPVLTLSARLARRMNRPYCVTPHGMLTEWSLANRRWKKRLALFLGRRKMLQRARFIHVLGASDHRGTSRVGLSPPLRTIPLGIQTQELEPLPAPGSFDRAWPALKGRPFVLFLSRLHPGKGLDILGEAFAMLARSHRELALVVVGPDAGAKAAFEQQMSALGLQDRIVMTGPLYDRAKVAALCDAVCFCLPSEHEACSVAILEALFCGLPVVISPECDRPEVQEVQAGRIVARQPKAIAKAIEEIIADPDLRARMSRAARELAMSRFTWEKVAARMIQMYQAEISSSGRAVVASVQLPSEVVR